MISKLVLAAVLPAFVSAQISPIVNFANRTTWPVEQTSNVTEYLKQAQSLATDPRLYQYFMDQCIVQQVYPQLFSMPSGYVRPFAAFDNLYFVGHTGVSSWAIDTGAGLILIDSLNNQGEVDKVMLPMLVELGFKGEDIKSVIITHEHLDHYGGALYLQNRFNATVYGSEVFWEAMASLPSNATPPAPRRGESVSDSVPVTLGNTTVRVLETPGHTLGTISLSFPVADGGEPHIAGLSGGTGTPTQKSLREMKVESAYKFAEFAVQEGIDVLLSNHQVSDHAVQNGDILEHRGEGEGNPFVIETEGFVNYLKINAICSQVIAARQGMNLDIDVSGNSSTIHKRDLARFFARSFVAEGVEHDCTH